MDKIKKTKIGYIDEEDKKDDMDIDVVILSGILYPLQQEQGCTEIQDTGNCFVIIRFLYVTIKLLNCD